MVVKVTRCGFMWRWRIMRGMEQVDMGKESQRDIAGRVGRERRDEIARAETSNQRKAYA